MVVYNFRTLFLSVKCMYVLTSTIKILLDYQYNTGSYNFSEAAEKRNAENLLFLKEKNIVQAYLQNFHKRLEQAQPFHGP